MRSPVWLLLGGVSAIYWALVFLLGFSGLVGLVVNFLRVTLAVAVLIIYVPALATIFQEVPPPRRDYLIAGIVLTWLSALLFAFGNEYGRVFGVNMSIFVNSVAGFFSLLLVCGGVFHIVAPIGSNQSRFYALAIGALASIGLVFIALYF